MVNNIRNMFLGISLSNLILLGIMLGLLLVCIPISIQTFKRQRTYKELFGLKLRKKRYQLSIFDINKYISAFGFIKNKNEWAWQHNKAVDNVEFSLLINHYNSDKYIIKRKGAW